MTILLAGGDKENRSLAPDEATHYIDRAGLRGS
jgi:hypothetical protein